MISGNKFHQRDIVLQRKDNHIPRVYAKHTNNMMACNIRLSFGRKKMDIILKSCMLIQLQGDLLLNSFCYEFLFLYVDGEKKLFQHYFTLSPTSPPKQKEDDYCLPNSTRRISVQKSTIHLRDTMNNEANSTEVGELVNLPLTFTGSLRNRFQYIQNILHICAIYEIYTCVRKYGRPNLFITYYL